MRVWISIAVVVAAGMGVWLGLGRAGDVQVWMSLMLGVWAVGGVIAFVGFRRRPFARLTVQDYIVAAMFIGLLYAAVLPWRLGLGRIPIIHPFVFAIPYSAIFIVGIRILPKPGGVTLMLCGKGILYQLLGTGINPLWWPDFLIQAIVIESYLLFTADHARTLKSALLIAFLRGLMAHLYFYFIGAPYIWHTFYEWWFILWQIAMGSAGCLVGAWIGHRLARRIEAAYSFGGI